jgi:hypothetical protein
MKGIFCLVFETYVYLFRWQDISVRRDASCPRAVVGNALAYSIPPVLNGKLELFSEVCSRKNKFRSFILPTLSQLAIIFSPEDK